MEVVVLVGGDQQQLWVSQSDEVSIEMDAQNSKI